MERYGRQDSRAQGRESEFNRSVPENSGLSLE
jgi:hypothetical protein